MSQCAPADRPILSGVRSEAENVTGPGLGSPGRRGWGNVGGTGLGDQAPQAPDEWGGTSRAPERGGTGAPEPPATGENGHSAGAGPLPSWSDEDLWLDDRAWAR